ncbi:hypothetical protein [Kribbella sp. CA-247076]|uniref:hypothetical protein n=1 Tax=Kribbella sp. CA-247076 TaxID=3239941 RepID=UPI003D8D1E40
MSRSISIPEPRRRPGPVVVVIIYLGLFYSLLGAAAGASVWYADGTVQLAAVSALTAAAIEMARRLVVYVQRCSVVKV